MKKLSYLYLLLLSIALTNSSCARPTRPETYYFGNYSEAEGLFQKGDYEGAIQKYQAYIDENPEGNLAVISQYYMGRSCAALGKKDEARVFFEKIIKQYPDQVWANFSQTQLEELNGASTEAVPSA